MVDNKTTFTQRLEQCIHQAGGVLPLALRSGVSRAQLHRYVRGGSAPTLKKVEAIANAVGVQPGWLVAGDNCGLRQNGDVVLDRELFLQVIEKIETVSQNRGLLLPPRRKALFMFAIAKAAEQTQQASRSFLLSETSLFEMIDFMRALPKDEDVQFLFEGMEGISKTWDSEKIKSWEKLLCQAHIAVYDTLSGRNYFERMGPVTGPLAEVATKLLEKVQALYPQLKDVLDLGCGNGRYLQFFHKYNPNLRLVGVDTSHLAAQYCFALEAQGLIPQGTFKQVDMRHLPFAPASFDFVFARNSLFSMPLMPHHRGGLDAVFAAIHKVLRPGGVFHGMSRYGKGLSFYIGQQLLDEQTLHELCTRHGFAFMGARKIDVNQQLYAQTPHARPHNGFSSYLMFELVKPRLK